MNPSTEATVIAIGQFGETGPPHTALENSRPKCPRSTPAAIMCRPEPTAPTAAAIAVSACAKMLIGSVGLI